MRSDYRVYRYEHLEAPVVTAGSAAVLIGAQNGLFPDMGYAVPGEMGGLWAGERKVCDGFFFAIDDVPLTQADACISAMEGRVGNVRLAFEEHGRWVDGTEGGVPKPGYLVIYGVRASTPYTHVAIVESVKEMGDGVYELTTIEGNLNSTVRRINYRYDATPKRQYYNMSAVPEDEITEENCQYKLQKDDWYVTGFCATW